MSEKVNVILNGDIVKGIKGETILETARRQGIEIPTLCNDPRLEPYTSCYVCVVEVEGMRGLQPSCSTRIYEGIHINTGTERVKRARKTALDLLVSDHYADCIGPCKQTCPAGVDVQGYISLIEKGQYHEAVALIKETNPLPAICGRVCVRPCEVACRRNLLDEGTPVGIDYLKRFAADYDLNSPDKWKPVIKPSTGKKVAVIGAGPAGLSSGFFLQKEGHQVDIFEGSPKAGGWLRYGIPEYRLPNDLLQKEVDNITEMGVNIHYQKRLGDNLRFDDLKKDYDAFILAIGSQKGTLVGCEGEDAQGVYSGIDFLKEMEMSGQKHDLKGKKVAVVGGGNTAMDCCRTSIRCGADQVYVVYRRTENEMPANPIEIHESKVEGVHYKFLTNPTKINKTEDGKVKSMTCLKMELGPPDASGRRRPIPVPDSEFDIEIDVVLAAIGQKTMAGFLDEINASLGNGQQLKLNRWGDIEADEKTLQTGIENIFAAGDGVTGPATLIQAIGQAKVAAHACNQFLAGKAVEPLPGEFLSKKENFKEQVAEDYQGFFKEQRREEMPVLPPEKRNNFDEVELGYPAEETALRETQRCLECGCQALYTCDLKKYSTDYGAEQKHFSGEFKEYKVDFRHPYVEIDNNKCILCGRCVRICREVVGADALGLVNRGFDTFVAPSMGEALQDTTCESCGLCISTCPTGAISENVPFKPGPVRLESAETICNYCSVGCAVNLEHKNGFVMRTTGAAGQVNSDGNLCRYPKFGYHYLNDRNRISRPMLKINGKFEEVSFEKAFELIDEKISSVQPGENAFFAGARLTNEEIYLVQKLARLGTGTHHIASFHYLDRGTGYERSSISNVPFEQLPGASKIYLLGSRINQDNAVAGFMVNNASFRNNVPVEFITTRSSSTMEHKVEVVRRIKSYYHFIKAVNYYLLDKGLHNGMFIKDRCRGFEDYREKLLKEDFTELVDRSGIGDADTVSAFAEEYNNQMNAVLIFSEKELSSNACTELINLALITGKLGKTSSGLIALREKNNSQGLFDMGAFVQLGVGGVPVDTPTLVEKMKKVWETGEIPPPTDSNLRELLSGGGLRNLFIFGEDPLGCAVSKKEVSGWLDEAGFVVVQDHFMTETARHADLILPASLPVESGGTFTNTQQQIQKFDAVMKPAIERLSWQQLADLLKIRGHKTYENPDDVMSEAFSLLPGDEQDDLFDLIHTESDNYNRLFEHGCDYLTKRFDEEFEKAISEN